jgi:cobalt-zinc-cadmium resistance protein CzcA
MQDLLGRLSLLELLDSAYRRFVEAAELRYKTGESRQLEKTSAQTEYSRLTLQRQQVLADLDILQQRMSYLLRINERLLPSISYVGGPPKAVSSSHPMVDFWRAQQGVYEAEAGAEKSNRLPEFQAGYSNLSLIGWQSPDGLTQKYYGSGDRFHTASLGVALPLFMGASKARTEASRIQQEVAGMQEQQALEMLQNRGLQLNAEYVKHQKALDHYQGTALPQSAQILDQAMMAYRGGEIGYMEWINLMNQAIDIRMGYLDALLAQRLVSAELEFINGR